MIFPPGFYFFDRGKVCVPEKQANQLAGRTWLDPESNPNKSRDDHFILRR
jgi:hypothetical protein